MKTVQYDTEGNVLPSGAGRSSCCSTVLVWLVLIAALIGGFAAAFLYHQRNSGCFAGRVEVVDVKPGTTTEVQLFFAKDEGVDRYFVASKKDGVLSGVSTQRLEDFGECIPTESRPIVENAFVGSIFAMRTFYNSDGRCVFGFLKQTRLFDEQGSMNDLRDILIEFANED